MTGATALRFRTARNARVLWALSMALVVASFLFRTWNTPGVVESLGLTGWDLVLEIAWWSVLIPAAGPAYAIVGLLIATRKPHNPIGWLALAMSIMIALHDMSWQYTVRAGAVEPGQWPGGEIAAWLSGWFALMMMPPLPFTLILLYYPAGQLVAPFGRRVMRLAVLSVLLGTLIAIAQPALLIDGTPGDGSWPRAAQVALKLAEYGTYLGFLGAALSIVLRYRRATGAERHQVKWLAYISVIIGVAFAAGMSAWSLPGKYYAGSAILSFVVFGSAIGIPATIGIAILKQRLYEIDPIINRTLVYGVLMAVLGVTYVCSVLALQYALRQLAGQQSSLAIVTSTLAIVALFAPLRNRIQDLIDRRFYRSKYDAEKMLAAFSKRLRSEVDDDRLTAGLMAVVDEAVHPSHVSLWMVKRPDVSRSAREEQG